MSEDNRDPPQPPRWADGSPVVIVKRRVPKIDPKTGEQAKDEETGELLETEMIDWTATFFANPHAARAFLSVAERTFEKFRRPGRAPVNDALIGTTKLPEGIERHPRDDAKQNHK